MSAFLRSPKLKISENHVEKACVALLERYGYWPIRLHAGLFKSSDGRRWIKGVEKGTPDWAAVIKPSFLVETKRPGAELSEVQRRKIDELKVIGLETLVVSDPQELLAYLEQLRDGAMGAR